MDDKEKQIEQIERYNEQLKQQIKIEKFKQVSLLSLVALLSK